MRGRHCHRRDGSVLFAVVLALTLVATLAYLMNREAAMEVAAVGGSMQVEGARYVAQAGFEHALWRVQQANCGGYSDLTSIAFGDHSYSAAVTPASGTPVAIAATGTLASGAKRSVERKGVAVYQSTSITTTLQPASEGKDGWVTSTLSNRNYSDVEPKRSLFALSAVH